MTPQREFPALIAARKPFRGNSVTAEKTQRGNYCVYSYDTLIAEWDNDGEMIHFDEKRYSSTTSKIQNLIRKLES